VTHLDANEALGEYVKRFGADDGFLVKNLTDRVSQLYDEWRLFIYLFAENQDRLILLSKSSGLMFETIQRALWDGVLTKVRHLTDPATTNRGQKNFSLAWLVEIARTHSELDYSVDWANVSEDCKQVRRYVDKYIAHLDDRHIRGGAKSPVSRKTTSLAIKSIGAFVQKFHEATCSTTMLLLPTLQGHDHQHVLYLLHLGHEKLSENEAVLKSDWRLGASDKFTFPSYLTDKTDLFDPF
jgi:hypothetical protein